MLKNVRVMAKKPFSHFLKFFFAITPIFINILQKFCMVISDALLLMYNTAIIEKNDFFLTFISDLVKQKMLVAKK